MRCWQRFERSERVEAWSPIDLEVDNARLREAHATGGSAGQR